jgi:spermidine synthase
MSIDDGYFSNGELFMNSGSYSVYQVKGIMYMKNNITGKVTYDNSLSDYIWQIGDKPKGNCLVVGLLFGTASRYILSLPRVEKLTVLEESKEIVEINNNIWFSKDKFTILIEDYLTHLYCNRSKYDFIFIDCYDRIDYSTIPYIADIVAASSKAIKHNGKIIGRLDQNTKEEFVSIFYNLFDNLP